VYGAHLACAYNTGTNLIHSFLLLKCASLDYS